MWNLNCHYMVRQSSNRKKCSPRLVFTETELPDGTWADLQALIEKTCSTAQLIVVSRFVDVQLYMRVIERKAIDLIVPPFYRPDVAHLVGSAALRRGLEPRRRGNSVA